MKLIDNWRKAARMFSVQAMALAASLQGAWAAVSPDLQAHVPAGWVQALTAVLLVAGIIGRLVQQDAVSK